MDARELPLFPLQTVLFPGARLSLRIFEPRYLDLVRDCAREGRGFGVCAIAEGSEVGMPPTHAAVGCEARIVDFTTLPGGLLGITVVGGRRFRVERASVRGDGLIVAEVAWKAPEERTPIAIEHELLATLLRRCFERLRSDDPLLADADYADAAWVGWRLAGVLPMELDERQALLELEDPHARLQRLLEVIERLQPE